MQGGKSSNQIYAYALLALFFKYATYFDASDKKNEASR
jgi:hypothetical protein